MVDLPEEVVNQILNQVGQLEDRQYWLHIMGIWVSTCARET